MKKVHKICLTLMAPMPIDDEILLGPFRGILPVEMLRILPNVFSSCSCWIVTPLPSNCRQLLPHCLVASLLSSLVMFLLPPSQFLRQSPLPPFPTRSLAADILLVILPGRPASRCEACRLLVSLNCDVDLPLALSDFSKSSTGSLEVDLLLNSLGFFSCISIRVDLLLPLLIPPEDLLASSLPIMSSSALLPNLIGDPL